MTWVEIAATLLCLMRLKLLLATFSTYFFKYQVINDPRHSQLDVSAYEVLTSGLGYRWDKCVSNLEWCEQVYLLAVKRHFKRDQKCFLMYWHVKKLRCKKL